MITGEFNVAIDDKGRLMIPAKLRSQIAGDVLWATKGDGPYLWLFTPEKYEKFVATLTKNATRLFNKDSSEKLRKHVAPAQDLKIDRTRRILIPPSLKTYATLKKEALILGLIDYIELWDVETYNLHGQKSDEKGVTEENQKKLEELIFF